MNAAKVFLVGIPVVAIIFLAVGFAGTGSISNIASVIGSQQKAIYAECILSYADLPLNAFAITSADLNEDNMSDALVRYKEGRECGNAGCVHEICLSDASGTFTHIPFGYAAAEISVLNTKSNDMNDLMLNNDKNLTMSWDGSNYVLNN